MSGAPAAESVWVLRMDDRAGFRLPRGGAVRIAHGGRSGREAVFPRLPDGSGSTRIAGFPRDGVHRLRCLRSGGRAPGTGCARRPSTAVISFIEICRMY